MKYLWMVESIRPGSVEWEMWVIEPSRSEARKSMRHAIKCGYKARVVKFVRAAA